MSRLARVEGQQTGMSSHTLTATACQACRLQLWHVLCPDQMCRCVGTDLVVALCGPEHS